MLATFTILLKKSKLKSVCCCKKETLKKSVRTGLSLSGGNKVGLQSKCLWFKLS